MAISGLPDQVTPGPPLTGGEGGQAVVYEILGDARYLLKVYKTAVTPQECWRIDRLIALAEPKLLRGAAWPLKRYAWQGKVALLLPRVDHAAPIHVLFERKSWIGFIPAMDWRFVVAVAARAALACARVHEAGLAVVDISDKNLLVTRDGDVTLIDCDSFVFKEAGPGGMSPIVSPGWLPPELTSESVGLIPRTANHDNFALARLIFKLLMNGSDPMGPPSGEDADTTRERVFVFSQRTQRRPPAPFELTLAALSSEVADLFEQAFAPPIAGKINRPTAAEWVLALGAMERQLRQCSVAPKHFYVPAQGRRCPWCALAARNAEFDPYRGSVTAAVVSPTPIASPTQAGAGASRLSASWWQQNPSLADLLLEGLKGIGGFMLLLARLAWRVVVWVRLGLLKLIARLLLVAWRPMLTVGVLVTMGSIIYFNIFHGEQSKPHRPPVSSDPSVLRAKARDFIKQYFADFSSNDAAAGALNEAFADNVCYMGLFKTKGTPITEQMKFVNKFPNRSYQPQLDNMDIQCSTDQTSCRVVVNVDYRAKQVWRVWKYLLILNVSVNEMKISTFGGCSENSICDWTDAVCQINN